MDPSQLLAAAGGVESLAYIAEGRDAAAAGRANARILTSNAEQVIAESNAAVEAQSRNIARQMGRQRAAIAQSGGFGGSAEDIARQSMAEAELDMLNTRYEGQMRARGLLTEAKMERWQGKVAKKQSYLKATASLLNTGGNYLAMSG